LNYNVTICELCNGPLTFRQLRESVYWLPDMDEMEFRWGLYEGFVHNFAHRACWKRLREKKRELYRILAFKGQEPRSMGQRV